MMLSPRVSVIIPTYQSAHVISDAINSVYAQSYPNLEVIVVDDGSTDDTQAVLTQHRSNITSVFQENKGQAVARNVGVNISNGEFIAFLDADDIWLPQKLENQLVLFENPHVQLVYGNIEYFYQSKTQRLSSFDLYPPKRGYVYKDLFVENFIPLSSAIVRRNVFLGLKGFLPEFTPVEDYEFFMRLTRLFEVDYTDSVVARYRISPNQSSANVQRMWTKFIETQKKNLLLEPDIILSLPKYKQDKGFYNKLLKLTIDSLRDDNVDQAKNWLLEYRRNRGKNIYYLFFSALILLPKGFRKILLVFRDIIRRRPEYGRW